MIISLTYVAMNNNLLDGGKCTTSCAKLFYKFNFASVYVCVCKDSNKNIF